MTLSKHSHRSNMYKYLLDRFRWIYICVIIHGFCCILHIDRGLTTLQIPCSISPLQNLAFRTFRVSRWLPHAVLSLLLNESWSVYPVHCLFFYSVIWFAFKKKQTNMHLWKTCRPWDESYFLLFRPWTVYFLVSPTLSKDNSSLCLICWPDSGCHSHHP